MTINQYSHEFERQLKLRNNSASTIATYTGILKQFLGKLHKDPRSITLRMVEDYLLTLNSTKYKRQTIYTLRHFYASVINLPGHLDSVPIPKQEKFVPNTLNVQEVHRLINCVDNLKQRACIQTMQNIFAGADARIQGAFTPPTPPAAQLTHQARA